MGCIVAVDQFKELQSQLAEMRVESQLRHDTLSLAFSDHVEYFAEHEQDEITRHNESVKAQAANTEAIEKLSGSTKALVDAINAGRVLAKFGRWLSSIAIIGVAFTWLAGKIN